MVLDRVTRGVQLGGAVRQLAVVAHRLTPTNRRLLEAARRLGAEARLLPAREAWERLCPGDAAVGRLDVLPSLDGVEPGLEELRRLELSGIQVWNSAATLLTTHDKLATALRLATVGVPHPRTAHVDADGRPELELPVVVKPRFGSWGRDVIVCRSRLGLRRTLRQLRSRGWLRSQGALVQELVPPTGRDLRMIVAGGQVVGAIERVAARGEWRTNVALGGERRPVSPPQDACGLALSAAGALGAGLVGVDLLPAPNGGWVVLELNGAVDFTDDYRLGPGDVFERAVGALLASGYARGDDEETEAPLLAAGARARA